MSKASEAAKLRAPVGVAIMARDAEKTLPLLLKSIRPYVTEISVGVDELTRDGTAKIAKRFGADEVYPLHVSDWHECADHGRVLAQHFANARQETFRHLHMDDLEYGLWLDADDVLQGGEHLADLCRKIPADSAGAWWSYHYSTITRQDGKAIVNTLFDRERLLRTHAADGSRIEWTWEGRVHETVKPDRPLQWIINRDIVVVHQQGAHATPGSASRNLLLLEIDYENDPKDQRTIFYLGNQHFAMGNWQQAIYWYEMLTSGIGTNPYELWNAYIYLSHAYERLEDLTNAARAAYGAMDVHPEHPEPYLRLMRICLLTEEYDKALYYDKMSDRMSPPPFFVFHNPMDDSYYRLLYRGEALYGLGRVIEARKVWEQAAEVLTDDQVAAALVKVRAREANMAAAEGFVQVAKAVPEQVPALYAALPEDVKAYGRTRDLVMPSLLDPRRTKTPRIVFWCGKSLESWAPPTLNTTGIGGSETAVIEIAKRFAADGWTVDVFNDADRFEGIYDGVGYWDCKRIGKDDYADVFVSWRQPGSHVVPISRGQSVLWCHDLNYGPEQAENFQHWDHVWGVSRWHADMLSDYYGWTADFVPNGIDISRFDPTIKKVPFRCVYASSPDRGLSQLLSFWPEIVKAEPAAELHVGYGWENIDTIIANGRRDLVAFREDTTRKIENTKGVVWRGRLPQNELAQLYSESVAWLYPADFLEVSCISAMEAMAAGCVPIVVKAGALPETIGDAGLLIPGPPQSRAFGDMFPKAALGVLCELNTRAVYERKGRARAQGFTWDFAYARWRSLLGYPMSGYEMKPLAERNGFHDEWITTADNLVEMKV